MSAPPSESVSAVILASRPASLKACLESLSRAAKPARFECLVALNGNDARCAQVVSDFDGRVPSLRTVAPTSRSLGGARNAALQAAANDWLCFLDDDVVIPADYFTVLADKAARYPEAAVIGGPNLTPSGSGLFERCAGHVLGSALCSARMRRRYAGFAEDSWTDDSGVILCNLCIRRRDLSEAGLRFDEDLVRNEENLLLSELASRGRRALHAPALLVHHERRSTLPAFCRQCYLSGRGRGEMTVKKPSTVRPLHAAPLLILFGIPAMLFHPTAFGLCADAYLAAAALNALRLRARHAEPTRALGWLFLLVPAAHLSYAAGLLAGLARGLLGPRAAAFREASHAG